MNALKLVFPGRSFAPPALRLAGLLIAIVFAGSFGVEDAVASQVRVVPRQTHNAELLLRAAPGEDNDVTVRDEGEIPGGPYRISDSAGITAVGDTCKQVSSTEAFCERDWGGGSDVYSLRFDLGDGDDRVMAGGLTEDYRDVRDGATWHWARPSLRLIGDEGNDILVGGPGEDVLEGHAGDDRLRAGPGNDQSMGHGGADDVDGGSGWDTGHAGTRPTATETAFESPYTALSFEPPYATAERTFFSLDGVANDGEAGEGDNVRNIDFFWPGPRYGSIFARGDAGPQSLYGTGGADFLAGGGGSDDIEAWEGSDELRGEDGNDKLAGGFGNDTIYGGDGNDQLLAANGDLARNWDLSYRPAAEDLTRPGDVMTCGSGFDVALPSRRQDAVTPDCEQVGYPMAGCPASAQSCQPVLTVSAGVPSTRVTASGTANRTPLSWRRLERRGLRARPGERLRVGGPRSSEAIEFLRQRRRVALRATVSVTYRTASGALRRSSRPLRYFIAAGSARR